MIGNNDFFTSECIIVVAGFQVGNRDFHDLVRIDVTDVQDERTLI